jgi:glutamine synthetase
MNRVAKRHGLKVLFHEKPFAGVNGSGKHNNWSMATDKGKNLLSPGSEPGNNLQFISFFVNVVKAINDNGDLLRASIASQANEHRLGANEAPPAIISVFTGSMIAQVLEEFKTKGLISNGVKSDEAKIDLKIHKIPEASLDNTDRNRTSPFPFTGNKFEFRAVGSSANCSGTMTVLNTIVAHQLIEFKKEVDAVIALGEEKESAIVKVLQRCIKDSERIIFNGDGYSKEWEEEAAKRGLKNIKSTPEALLAMITPHATKLLVSHNIFTERELHARYEVLLEEYIKKMDIEMLVMEEMIYTHILPASYDYQNKLIQNFGGLFNMGLNKASDKVKEEVEIIFNHMDELKSNVKAMMELREEIFAKKDNGSIAAEISEKVKPYFEKLRHSADHLEKVIDDSSWKLPKYRELLFLR